MSTEPIIFTSVAWAGDFLRLLPVASWFYKTKNRKVHFVVTKNYYMYDVMKSFIEYQEYCHKVTMVDVGSNAWSSENCNFNPADFGIEGEYYNFGLNDDSFKSLTYAYALQHNLGIDDDFKLNVPVFENVEIYDKVTIPVINQKSGYWAIWRREMPNDVVELNLEDEFSLNVYKIQQAKECHLGCSALSVIADMLDKKMTVYAFADFNPNMFYTHKHEVKYI
jgi:hypothetical protein